MLYGVVVFVAEGRYGLAFGTVSVNVFPLVPIKFVYPESLYVNSVTIMVADSLDGRTVAGKLYVDVYVFEPTVLTLPIVSVARTVLPRLNLIL